MNHPDSSNSGDTHEGLTAYVGRRTHLASQAGEFQCEPDCTRPGCKSPDLQVPVSLVDILAAARRRGESVSAAYRRHYVLGLFYNDTDYCLRTVSLKVRKPCPFLAEDLCGIYPLRPLPCILFPEYLVHRGTFKESAKIEQFRDYLCMHRPLKLSPERARVLSTLGKMWERESLVTSLYLFGDGLCHLDFTDLIPELLTGGHSRETPPQGPQDKGRAGASAGKSQPAGVFPPDPSPVTSEEKPPATVHQVLEDFFQTRIAGLSPFAEVHERIAALDTPETQAQFLELLQADGLYKKLVQESDDRALVFRFTKGRLRPQRRSILPSEYKFYA